MEHTRRLQRKQQYIAGKSSFLSLEKHLAGVTYLSSYLMFTTEEKFSEVDPDLNPDLPVVTLIMFKKMAIFLRNMHDFLVYLCHCRHGLLVKHSK